MEIKISLNCRRMLYALFMLLISCNLFSQITVKLNERPVKEVLKEIESRSSFRFFYNNDLKGLDKIVSLNIYDKDIDTTLEQLFANSEIDYQKQENNIILLVPKTKIDKASQKKRLYNE